MKVNQRPFGLFAQTSHGDVAFFKKNIPFADIKSVFKNSEYHRLKQTHSDTFVLLSKATRTDDPTLGCSAIEGDALFLNNSDRSAAIGVSTADCLPVMITGPDLLVGIHAGWRGVENEIILKTLRGRISAPKETFAFIGPHIQWSSFEVDSALGEKFKAQYIKLTEALSIRSDISSVFKASDTDTKKSFINLSIIAQLQLQLAGLARENIWISNIDTKTDSAWGSFRRDGKDMGKNLSFVARPNR